MSAGPTIARALSVPPVEEQRASAPTLADATEERRRSAIVREHLPFVCRSLRRLGVRPSDLDDVAQEVFLVMARNVEDIQPGRERGYLFRTCMFLASHARRAAKRRREVVDDERVGEEADDAANPEQHAVASEARERLQRIIDAMPEDFRSAFVLFELERMTMPEIADTLRIPYGTVASRLRRARELFMASATRNATTGGSR